MTNRTDSQTDSQTDSLSWIIFGAKGWIGQQVVDIMCDMRPDDTLILTDVRADDDKAIRQLFATHTPDRVMSLIGRTHGPGCNTVDYLEGGKDKLYANVQDNLYAPVLLALLCQQYDIHFTYLGTGCIFSGDNDAHTEDEKPNFFGSSYSIVKGFTDRIMHAIGSTTLNVRIRMPITTYHHPRNFITKIASYKKICSTSNSITVLPELLPIMIDMAVKKMTGTVNLTNPGTITHNQVLELYKKYVDPTHTWENISVDEQNAMLASQRSCCTLATELLQCLYPHVRSASIAIEQVMQQYVNVVE